MLIKVLHKTLNRFPPGKETVSIGKSIKAREFLGIQTDRTDKTHPGMLSKLLRKENRKPVVSLTQYSVFALAYVYNIAY